VSAASAAQDTRTIVALTVTGTPTTGYAATGTKYQVAQNGNGVGASFEAAKFSYVPMGGNGISFYFGALDVGAVYNNSTQIVNISGALAEIAASIGSIFLYSNLDNNNGFQLSYQTNGQMNDPFDCTSTHDCIVMAPLAVSSLSWSAITVDSTACPSSSSGTVQYVDNQCKVWKLTSSAPIGAGSITVSLYLASQPVMVSSSAGGSPFLVGPDGGEFELTIVFPWPDPNYAPQNTDVRLGLIAYAAGKVVTGGFNGQVTTVNGNPGFAFQGANSHVSKFTWANAATVANSPSTVYVSSATGDTILNTKATGWTLEGAASLLVLDVDIGWLKAFGWSTVVVFYSWNDVNPASVYWDPTIGQQSTVSSNFSNTLSAPLVFILMMIVFLYNANKH